MIARLAAGGKKELAANVQPTWLRRINDLPSRNLRFLCLALLWAGLAPLASQVRDLTILHTNDLHARLLPDGRRQGGFAHLAAAIRREQAGCGHCLLLDGGDLVQGTPVSTLYRGLPVFEVRNLFRPDVATLGNHEFDYGWRRAREFLRVAKFPIVSANVQDENGRLFTQPYVVRPVNGVRVAVIGAMLEQFRAMSIPELVGPWRAAPVVEAARRYAAEVRERSDLVVLLGHIAPEEEDRLLAEAPEVAVIISGHLHRGLEEPKAREKRVVVRVRAYGVELGRLDLKVDVANKAVASSSWNRIPIDSTLTPAAPDVARAVARWEAKVARQVDLPIGEARREIAGRDLKLLMEQAMIEQSGVELAYMNQGGVRDFLPKGPLLARHVWNVMPFDNTVVVAKVRGRDLPKAVVDGRPIDPERDYTLAVNNYVAANQVTELGTSNLQFSRSGPLQRDQLIAWIRKKRVLE